MFNDGILEDHRKVKIAPTLYETPTEEEQKEYNALKSIEIDVE
jgi:hypothetical protein